MSKIFAPRLVRATVNQQYATRDPGAFAYNGSYVIQVLYDTPEDVGTDVGGAGDGSVHVVR